MCHGRAEKNSRQVCVLKWRPALVSSVSIFSRQALQNPANQPAKRAQIAHRLQPKAKAWSVASSEACAASSTSTVSNFTPSRSKILRPVPDRVVKTISASCTKDSSRFSRACTAGCRSAPAQHGSCRISSCKPAVCMSVLSIAHQLTGRHAQAQPMCISAAASKLWCLSMSGMRHERHLAHTCCLHNQGAG